MEKILTVKQEKSWDYFIIFSLSILISLCAYVQIPLFFTPVPLVIQNSMAVLFGALLGSKKGSLAIFLFMTYGCLNLPVFANGTFGLMVLLSPTGGYIIGYLIAAYVTGRIIETEPKKAFFAILLGHLIILALGYLSLAQYLGWEKGFYLGILPFIAADMLKAVIATKIVKKMRHNRAHY